MSQKEHRMIHSRDPQRSSRIRGMVKAAGAFQYSRVLVPGLSSPCWGLLLLTITFLVAGIAITCFAAYLGARGTYLWEAIIGTLLFAPILILRQDELALVCIIAIHLYVDWYYAFYITGLVLALAMLCILYLTRSPQRPWATLQAPWLWTLFLALTLFPALQGATNLYDAAFYYPNIICGAVIFFWLGTLIARNTGSIRRLFSIISLLATLLSIHTCIAEVTGIFFFASTRFDAFLLSVSSFALSQNTHRIGSFFINPDWNGTFFAIMLFIPLGLLLETTSLLAKIFYLAQTLLMLTALLFTYSAGALLGTFAGLIVFIVCTGHIRHRILLPFFCIAVFIVMLVCFPSQIAVLFQHASGPSELSLRLGAWQTAIRIMQANPLSGIGLGLYTYLAKAEAYRVPAQYIPLAHPHNSYLELGAMAGFPVLFIFLALLVYTLCLAYRNWAQADAQTRCLIDAGIATVVALSINSISINGWTLPPLAAIGWLVLGIIASPLIRKKNCSLAQRHQSRPFQTEGCPEEK